MINYETFTLPGAGFSRAWQYVFHDSSDNNWLMSWLKPRFQQQMVEITVTPQ